MSENEQHLEKIMNWAESDYLTDKPVNTIKELGAYEFLWTQPNASTKRLADLFRESPGDLPSDLVDEESARRASEEVLSHFENRGIKTFGIRIYGTPDYPNRLRDAVHPVEMLYFQGSWDLIDAPRRMAVVGTRKVTSNGAARTARLVRELVENDFTIISGLAQGVDTIAHETAISRGGRTIAVIGTPISEIYPKENAELQKYIADHHLVVSQVPVLRYISQGAHINRFFFPERNKTMSAISDATIIVEASETSGTLIQARAALEQGRKLFILESNFNNPSITWPAKYEQKGAIRVKNVEDVLREF